MDTLFSKYCGGNRVVLILNFCLKKSKNANQKKKKQYKKGPIAEEWIYRACICSVLIRGGFPPYFAIVASPIYFALCFV